MSPSSIGPGDLLDLKLMPAWVKEPAARPDYAEYEGKDFEGPGERHPHRRPRREKPRGKDQPLSQRLGKPEGIDRRGAQRQRPSPPFRRHHQATPNPQRPLDVAVQFLPRR